MRTPRARRPVWNNPRRQLPGTGIRREVLLSLVIIWRTMFQEVVLRAMSVLVKKDRAYFQIQETVFHLSILLYHH